MTIAVGLLALCIGFGFWWIYFDLVGRRLPRNGPALTNWVLSHFPITLSIVAVGAAIFSQLAMRTTPAHPRRRRSFLLLPSRPAFLRCLSSHSRSSTRS